MNKHPITLLLLLVFITSCHNHDNQNKNFAEIKKLEYSRSANPDSWRSLYANLQSQQERAALLTSASMLKSDSLLPFYSDILKDSSAGFVYREALFAIGQTGSLMAEELLLGLPFESLSDELKKPYIQSLSRCCSKKSVTFFTNLIFSDYADDALTALALCQRKKIDANVPDSTGSQAQAYYLNYAADYRDIPNLVRMFPNQNELAKKYIFKTLFKKAFDDSARFMQALRADSLAAPKLLNYIRTSLNSKADWKQKLYALNLIPYLQDSLLAQLSKSFLQSQHSHLRLAAIKAQVISLDSETANSFILTQLNEEKNMFVRGQLLLLLAGTNNETAYRIIMQDLDRGDDSYKILLLDALAKTGLKSAFTTLQQFINIPNPQLANRAFENLSSLGRVGTRDLNAMLDSDSFSSVSLALEWASEHKRKIPLSRLLALYAKFNTPKEFEAQVTVLQMMSTQGVVPDSSEQRTIWAQASHPFLYNRIRKAYPTIRWDRFEPKPYLSFLPGFLQPDSLVLPNKNPLILLKTSRGDITIELFPGQAPLTVQNFLALINSGFYNNLSFHRVIADFVIQGGDPLGDGWGGAEYLIPSEDNELPFVQGSVGIATSGFDTGSCQFFICHSEQPHLTRNYTNFGIVKEGIAVVDEILPGDKIIELQLLAAD